MRDRPGEAFVEVHEQRRHVGGGLPVQEASYKVEFAEDPADFEEGGGGLPVFALDLVESRRARELEVELVIEVEPVWRWHQRN